MLPRAFLRATLPLHTSSTLPRLAATPFTQFTRSNTTTTTDPSGPEPATELPTQPATRTPKWPRSPPSSVTPPTPEQATPQSQQAPELPITQPPSTLKSGTVVSAGRMDKCVKVAHRSQIWDAHIRKFYPRVTTFLVSDPCNSLREGDVVEFSSGHRRSKTVRHVVERIVAPFGEPVDARPPIMSAEERMALRVEEIRAKHAKRVKKAMEMGFEGEASAVVAGPRMGRIKRLVTERVQKMKEREAMSAKPAGMEEAGLQAEGEGEGESKKLPAKEKSD